MSDVCPDTVELKVDTSPSTASIAFCKVVSFVFNPEISLVCVSTVVSNAPILVVCPPTVDDRVDTSPATSSISLCNSSNFGFNFCNNAFKLSLDINLPVTTLAILENNALIIDPIKHHSFYYKLKLSSHDFCPNLF